MTTYTVQLDDEIAKAVERKAASVGKSVDAYVAEVIQRDAASRSLEALHKLWALADQQQWKSDDGAVTLSDDEMYLR